MQSNAIIFATLLAACGDSTSLSDAHPDFDAAPDTTLDASDAAIDAPLDAAGCGSLPAQPSEVFVDRASTASSIGTAACPFHSIVEATSLPAPDATHPRSIRVAGAIPAQVYNEAALIAIAPHLAIVGAGETQVAITGGGACTSMIAGCTISIAGGGGLRGVTVSNPTGNALEVVGGAGAALIDHVIASGSMRAGFLVRGPVTLDHVEARDNQGDGLNAKAGVVTVVASKFINNQGDGLDIDQGATLDLTGGQIHNNKSRGVLLHNGTQSTALMHRITGADIQQNLFAGVDCAGNASLRLRGTTMFQNELGVLFQVGANQLDIGTAADPGNNIFAGATAVNRNVRAGLCMEQTPATPVQQVEANAWTACPPPQRKITGPFCVSNNTYSDIAYVPAVTTSGAPAIPPTTCAIGP